MYNPYGPPPSYGSFRENAIRPTECFQSAVDLVKPVYGLMVGITLVATLITLFSCSLLHGPISCGMFLAYFKLMRREPVSFDALVKGFDYIVPSLVVFAVHFVISMVLSIPDVVIGMMAEMGRVTGETGVAASAGLSTLALIVRLGTFFTQFALGVLFAFAYQLVVDRGLSGPDALKLSMQAAAKNFVGILLLSLLAGIVNLAGVLACCIGLIFVLPISYGMMAVGYRQVFPDIFPPAPAYGSQAPPYGGAPYGGPYR